MSEDKRIKITKKELSQDFRDEFVKNLQGKDYILYGGLITLAHAEGCKGIRSRVVDFPREENDWTAVVEAVAIDANGNEWSGIGDANDHNCNSKIKVHRIRMAETRAKGRAIRDMLGIDMLLDGELTDPYEREMITQSQVKTIKKIMEQRDIDKNIAALLCFNEFGVKTSARLTKEQADMFIAMLELYEENDEVQEESSKPAKSAPPVQLDEEEEDYSEEDDDDVPFE